MGSMPIDLRNPHRTIHVGVVLLNSPTELLDVAPIDFFNGISKETMDHAPPGLFPHPEQALDIKFHWVNETGKAAQLTAGLSILPTDTFANCPPLDVSLMGAHRPGYEPTETEVAYMKKVYEECSHFLVICGGMMAPLSAGILQGKTATAPRPMLPQIRKMAPMVNWTEKRWEHDDKIWTSGALLNGTDMIRAWAHENLLDGEDTLVRFALDTAGWPVRDAEYHDDDARKKKQSA